MKKISVLLVATTLGLGACTAEEERRYFDEYTVAALQALMEDGSLTARELTEYYLDRIDKIDQHGPRLNSIIELNIEALSIADELDRERQAGGSRGPLHGIPIVLKANIDTADRMSTTAGSLALEGHRTSRDAHLVTRLREAGAIILGKANLSEWANFRSNRSSSGWSSIGGQTRNPYELARNPCGSSSGSAVAVSANLTVLAVGTETNGSIICPAGINGIVGIKPSLGLISRSGVIPIAHSQDTAGPMARTVTDAAIMLSAMAGPDPEDAITSEAPQPLPDFAADLRADALDGKRIGVLRTYYGAEDQVRVRAIFEHSVEVLRAQGAEIVDPIEIDPAGTGEAAQASSVVLQYEFKADLARYLERSNAPIRTLADVIAFNNENADRVMPIFGQDRMLAAEARGSLSDPEYIEALEKSKRITREAIDHALTEHQLDALIAPSNEAAWMTDHVHGDAFKLGSSGLAAISGYASITVPAGFISGLPIGVSFVGGEFSDRALIEIAYAFEQASKVRQPPAYKKPDL